MLWHKGHVVKGQGHGGSERSQDKDYWLSTHREGSDAQRLGRVRSLRLVPWVAYDVAAHEFADFFHRFSFHRLVPVVFGGVTRFEKCHGVIPRSASRAYHRSPMNMQNVTAWRPDGTRARRFRSQRIPNSKSSGPIAQFTSSFTSSSAKRPELYDTSLRSPHSQTPSISQRRPVEPHLARPQYGPLPHQKQSQRCQDHAAQELRAARVARRSHPMDANGEHNR